MKKESLSERTILVNSFLTKVLYDMFLTKSDVTFDFILETAVCIETPVSQSSKLIHICCMW